MSELRCPHCLCDVLTILAPDAAHDRLALYLECTTCHYVDEQAHFIAKRQILPDPVPGDLPHERLYDWPVGESFLLWREHFEDEFMVFTNVPRYCVPDGGFTLKCGAHINFGVLSVNMLETALRELGYDGPRVPADTFLVNGKGSCFLLAYRFMWEWNAIIFVDRLEDCFEVNFSFVCGWLMKRLGDLAAMEHYLSTSRQLYDWTAL